MSKTTEFECNDLQLAAMLELMRRPVSIDTRHQYLTDEDYAAIDAACKRAREEEQANA